MRRLQRAIRTEEGAVFSGCESSIAVGRGSRSRVFITVVKLCALGGVSRWGRTLQATRKGFLLYLALSRLEKSQSLAINTYLVVAVVVGHLEVSELGLHVVVLLRDPSELFREFLVALLVAGVGLLVTLDKKKNTETQKQKNTGTKTNGSVRLWMKQNLERYNNQCCM